MKRFYLLVVGLLLLQTCFAQQIPLFTQYRNNIGILNPAALNADFHVNEHYLSFGASYRKQWVGLEGAPETQTIRGEYLYDTGNKFSFLSGGYIVNDQTGPTGFTGAYARFAGVLTDDPYFGGLSIGFNIGMVQYRVNASELRLRDAGDILTMEDQTKVFPDVGFGIYYYKIIEGGALDDDLIYGGISVPQIFGLNLDFQDDSGNFSTQRVQHFYGLIGLYHYFDNDSYIEPSAWIHSAPGVPVNVDMNLRYQFPGSMWVGTGVSTAGTIHLETGFAFGEDLGWGSLFKIGYGFDRSFSTFGPEVNSTHEINFSISIE